MDVPNVWNIFTLPDNNKLQQPIWSTTNHELAKLESVQILGKKSFALEYLLLGIVKTQG